jgi:hypothetical protein
VWGLVGVVAVEILVTYWQLPARELYHVSGSGPTGGFSRALVFANWPVALVAIPILVLLQQLLGDGARVPAVIGIVLSAAVFWPGMVKDSDLDARGVNAIAALGVGVALSLTLFAAHRLRKPQRLVRLPSDRLRLLVAAVAIGVSVPWIAADLGFFFNGVPALGSIYQTGELRHQPGKAGVNVAVHHGHHHGLDGALLVLSALLLSHCVSAVPSRRLRGLLGAYLALLLAYGAGNVANDFWLEQVVKRGWTDWEFPAVTTPKASLAWGVIVLAAALVFAVEARRDRGKAKPLSRRTTIGKARSQ